MLLAFRYGKFCRRRAFLRLYLLAIWMLVFPQGCTSQGAPENDAEVIGLIRRNGKPAGPFTVNLMSPTRGVLGQAEAGEDGRFQFDKKVPAGDYAVYLSAPRTGRLPQGVSRKYFSDTGTDLRVVLEPGANDLELILDK